MYTNVEIYNYKQVFKNKDAKSIWDMECGEFYRFVMTESKFVDISKWSAKDQIRFMTLIGSYNIAVQQLCEFTHSNNVTVFNKKVIELKFTIKSNLSSAMSMMKKHNKIEEKQNTEIQK